MTFAAVGGGSDYSGPLGYTYAAVVVRLPDGPGDDPSSLGCTRADVLAALRELRFTGWLGDAEDGWVAAVAAAGAGAVASGRRGVVGLGERLAERLATVVVAVRVVDDRQLLLAMWSSAEEIGRYVSDPSHGLGPGDDTLPDALGVEHADMFAAACGRPDAVEDLAELLAEELDADSVIESERLAGVLRLLGLPRWLVAAASLPRDVPAGPRAHDLTRLSAGRTGSVGWVSGRAADVVRRRRPPPQAIVDAPRGGSDIDPWLF